MAQLGIPERFGAEVAMPRRVKALERRRVIDVAGGLHHALACTDEGELFTWGSCGCGAVGLRRSDLDEENTVLDEDGTPLFVTRPTQVERKYPRHL